MRHHIKAEGFLGAYIKTELEEHYMFKKARDSKPRKFDLSQLEFPVRRLGYSESKINLPVDGAPPVLHRDLGLTRSKISVTTPAPSAGSKPAEQVEFLIFHHENLEKGGSDAEDLLLRLKDIPLDSIEEMDPESDAPDAS